MTHIDSLNAVPTNGTVFQARFCAYGSTLRTVRDNL